MRGRLIRQQIRDDTTFRELGDYVRAITSESNGNGLAFTHRILENTNGFIKIVDHDVAVAASQTLLDALRINIDAEERRAAHGRGERLCATHAAESTCD